MNNVIIAVIEDEAPIRKFLRASLTNEGYRVIESATAAEGMRSITQDHPNIIVLDLGLPDRDGVDIIRAVRAWSTTPILILSARDREADKIIALDAGADDYLTKPFGVGELLARIRAALRTAARLGNADRPPQTIFHLDHITIDLERRQVLADDKEIKLTKLEFDLLKTLMQHAGKVLTHRFLLKTVWGPDCQHEPHHLRVFVANLRKKLEVEPARPRFLLTEQGVGYRLLEPG